MNISSVVIRVRPERLASVKAALQAMPGVEIHAVADECRVAATLEDNDAARAADHFVALHTIPGVLTVTLIYQYDDSDVQQAAPPGVFNPSISSGAAGHNKLPVEV
jgi:periplasmic nitrate reductase NapD